MLDEAKLAGLVEFGGAAAFLSEARQADVTLFV